MNVNYTCLRKNYILIILALMFVFSSCSIQKKKYSRGFTFQPKTMVVQPVVKTEHPINLASEESEESEEQSVLVASQSFVKEEIIQESKVVKLASVLSEDCDVLTTMDGEEIKCIVVEILITEIKYKKCGFEDGPLISIKRNDVFMIKYRNGEGEKITHVDKSKNSVPDKKESDNISQNIDEVKPKRSTDALGVFALIISIVATFIPGLNISVLLLALAFLFAQISIIYILTHRDKKKGIGFGIAALIIALVTLALLLVLLL